jgi:hypothetical protein
LKKGSQNETEKKEARKFWTLHSTEAQRRSRTAHGERQIQYGGNRRRSFGPFTVVSKKGEERSGFIEGTHLVR